MTKYEALILYGHPIHITTKEIQRRRHKKKRINKKWRKRYGCIEINYMPEGKIMMYDGVFFMNKKTFEDLKKGIKNEQFERLKDYAAWNKKIIDAECKRNEPFYEEVRRRLRSLQGAQAVQKKRFEVWREIGNEQSEIDD